MLFRSELTEIAPRAATHRHLPRGNVSKEMLRVYFWQNARSGKTHARAVSFYLATPQIHTLSMTDINPNQMRDRLGNIDQIRDILFGDREREYTERLDRIEVEVDELSRVIEARLSNLENQISTDLQNAIDALEKKIQFVSSTLNTDSSEIRQGLQTVERDLAGNIVIEIGRAACRERG